MNRTIEGVRITLSALWVARMLTGLLGDVLRFLEPGMIDEVRAGGSGGMQITEPLLLVSAGLMTLPILMVVLSLTLSHRVCRWANIGLAVFLFVFDATGLATYDTASSVLLIAVGMGLNVATIGYAWRWRTGSDLDSSPAAGGVTVIDASDPLPTGRK